MVPFECTCATRTRVKHKAAATFAHSLDSMHGQVRGIAEISCKDVGNLFAEKFLPGGHEERLAGLRDSDTGPEKDNAQKFLDNNCRRRTYVASEPAPRFALDTLEPVGMDTPVLQIFFNSIALTIHDLK